MTPARTRSPLGGERTRGSVLSPAHGCEVVAPALSQEQGAGWLLTKCVVLRGAGGCVVDVWALLKGWGGCTPPMPHRPPVRMACLIESAQPSHFSNAAEAL